MLRRPWPEDADLRNQLLSLLGQEGRFDDARRLIEIRWDDLGRSRSRPGSRDARLALLREHVGLDFETIPLEGNMAQVQGQADDDRLRLARAYLATRLGRFEEAGAGLEAVLKWGADDPVVWRARMDWAMAAGELGPLRQALDHLSADQIDPTRVQRLRVWLAARRGDTDAERLALEGLVAQDPGDAIALTRLAELTHQAGDAPAAARLRDRKGRLDGDRERYFRLYKQSRFSEDLVDLARLADRLGRRFEARGFYELVRQQDPDNREARLALARLAPAPPARC